MSRKLWFRAWNAQLKHMIYFDMHHMLFNYGSVTGTIQSSILGLRPEDVMQYTGLKDNNNQEIYEGDIVRVEGVSIGQIQYAIGGFRITYADGHKQSMEDITQENIEVIGNTYEPPHVLPQAN